MEVFEVKAGQTMPKELNKHNGQEFNFILEGTLKVIIENNEIILNKGDSIYFDSGHAHAMCAYGGRDARFLAVII
jgi:quercetin dioxygenase-like cupin family protein